MKKIAINGFGRIGRILYRLLFNDESLEVVAINDLSPVEDLAYLLKYDTAQGNFLENEITYDGNDLIVRGKHIKCFSEQDPSNLPWGDLGIDLVFECSGHFTSLEVASKHITAGSKKVIISAPAKGDMKTIVYGVNDYLLDGTEEVVSTASCTTNCLAPVLKVIDDNLGIIKGMMTTVHAVTNDQNQLDAVHRKGILSRRGRAACFNIVPTSTGAASAIGKVMPSLDGKLTGLAMRVPVLTGSVIDLSLELKRNTTVEEVNAILRNNANEVLNYTEDPVVSSDIIGSSCASKVDGLLTDLLEVDGKQMVKIISWYDNEYGYSSQMIRTAKVLLSK